MSTLIPLESIRIANPCHADWDKMQGDDRVRFCQSCAKNVFNLSELNRVEAEKLITEKQGNLCVQYYQRKDGTILTDDCPVGLKIIVRPFKWILAGFVAVLTAVGMARASAETIKVAGGLKPRKKAPAKPIVEGRIARPKPRPTPIPNRVKDKQQKRVVVGQLIYRPAPKPKPKE